MMPSRKADDKYEKLLEIYKQRGFRQPKLSLNYDIEQMRSEEGKNREKAISTLYRREVRQLHLRQESLAKAERRIIQLEKELEELRTSMRNRTDEMESIKKYLAYTHRLTTSQVIARIIFYAMGATLVILSFFQYQALTVYMRAASGFEWVFVLDAFVTLSLGISTIALGWVLESMARSKPVF
jgi:predicted RNase H-like nuclease (RuvC/YqgF family)